MFVFYVMVEIVVIFLSNIEVNLYLLIDFIIEICGKVLVIMVVNVCRNVCGIICVWYFVDVVDDFFCIIMVI